MRGNVAPASIFLVGSLVALLASSEPASHSTNMPAWALRPVTRPGGAAVQNQQWIRTPIDRFILARLEKEGLEPAPAADKATLLRRATFDLHGLPPSPAELAALEADHSPEAFVRVVDRLLASPRYGERWARHWLDVARFAESHGFEFDRLRENAWRYRDYVVASFNANKPYDEFVRDQLAGDTIEPGGAERIAATGFLVAGPWDEAGYTSASSLLKERIREEELEDMIAAVGQTFLGLTINCARCHDHKFDPIPQRDYYRIKAALAGVRHGERDALTPEEKQARENKASAWRRKLAALEDELFTLETRARGSIAARLAREKAYQPSPVARWTFEANVVDSIAGLPATLEGGARIAGGRLKLNGKSAFAKSALLPRAMGEKTLEAWVTLATLEQRGGAVVSLESQSVFDAIVFAERESKKWMAGSSYFQRTRSLEAPAETATGLVHVAIAYGADNRITFYRNGLPHGKSYVPEGENAALQRFGPTNAHLLFGLRHTGAQNGYLAGEIEEVRLYERALSAEEIAASFNTGPLLVSEQELAAALTSDENRRREMVRAQADQTRAALASLAPAPRVYAANSTEPGPVFVLHRGDVEKKVLTHGHQQVSAGGLSAVTDVSFEASEDAAEGQRRAGLAAWITDRKNPLTARVMANRLWHYHFGRGLSGFPNDFGVNGEFPSHPELLDWLAAEFVASGWNIKHLHRLIMVSSVYRQGAVASPETARQARAVDADNRLLWKFPLRRLEGEAVRDSLLSLSGHLNLKLGGPSYRPFKVTVSGSNFYEPIEEDQPEFLRRSIYRMGVHSGRDAMLDTLDCPDPSTKTPVRAVTTTPLQSLSLMNNPFIVRQTRAFTERLRQEAGSRLDAQVELAYRLAFGRGPSSAEISRGAELAREHGLESLAWTLVNASEFVYAR